MKKEYVFNFKSKFDVVIGKVINKFDVSGVFYNEDDSWIIIIIFRLMF